jgi:hypothetical protein
MKILICSKIFYPANDIGAVRPTNFTKYLVEFGHQITIVTSEKNSCKILPGTTTIFIDNSKTWKKIYYKIVRHIDQRNESRSIQSQPETTADKIVLKPVFQLKNFYRASRRQLLNLIYELDWYYQAKNSLKNKFIKKEFDIVISSYGPLGSFLIGRFISKSQIATYWISDLRDNMSSQSHPFWVNLLYRFYERTMLRRARAVIMVSDGQVLMLKKSTRNISKFENKIHVIHNGYENDIKIFENKNEDKILRILYTGQLYSSIGKFKMRNFEMLFRALSELLDGNLIDPKYLLLKYVGKNAFEFEEQQNRYKNLKEICKYMGYVDRSLSQDLQKKCDILVVLTWNTSEYQGVLTGKFIEYMQAYKPIISITSGDLPNGELSVLIKELNLGLACEYVTFDSDLEILKEYILEQYSRVQRQMSLDFHPNLEEIKKYHYRELSTKLNDLCNSLIQNNEV